MLNNFSLTIPNRDDYIAFTQKRRGTLHRPGYQGVGACVAEQPRQVVMIDF